jgi:hypothetical protein
MLISVPQVFGRLRMSLRNIWCICMSVYPTFYINSKFHELHQNKTEGKQDFLQCKNLLDGEAERLLVFSTQLSCFIIPILHTHTHTHAYTHMHTYIHTYCDVFGRYVVTRRTRFCGNRKQIRLNTFLQ